MLLTLAMMKVEDSMTEPLDSVQPPWTGEWFEYRTRRLDHGPRRNAVLTAMHS